MVFTYGTGFYGKIATHNNQWIETKFFHIMFVPLFPIGSMYVTASEFKRRGGLDIDTNSKSVVATYARLFSFIAAAIAFFSAFTNNFNFLYHMALAILLAGIWVYFCFFYGKARKNDLLLRDKVGSITGFYALPHYFDHSFLYSRLDAFEKEYKQVYPGNNWQADLMTDDVEITAGRRRILFGIALFNCVVNNSPENDELYIKADALYQL